MTRYKELRIKNLEKRLAADPIKTPAEQLKHLDKLFGVGLGAKKERAKIAKKLLSEQKQ